MKDRKKCAFFVHLDPIEWPPSRALATVSWKLSNRLQLAILLLNLLAASAVITMTAYNLNIYFCVVWLLWMIMQKKLARCGKWKMTVWYRKFAYIFVHQLWPSENSSKDRMVLHWKWMSWYCYINLTHNQIVCRRSILLDQLAWPRFPKVFEWRRCGDASVSLVRAPWWRLRTTAVHASANQRSGTCNSAGKIVVALCTFSLKIDANCLKNIYEDIWMNSSLRTVHCQSENANLYVLFALLFVIIVI